MLTAKSFCGCSPLRAAEHTCTAVQGFMPNASGCWQRELPTHTGAKCSVRLSGACVGRALQPCMRLEVGGLSGSVDQTLAAVSQKACPQRPTRAPVYSVI